MTEDMNLIGTDIQMQTRMNSSILGRKSKNKVKLSYCHFSCFPEAKYFPWPVMQYHFLIGKEFVSGSSLSGDFGS